MTAGTANSRTGGIGFICVHACNRELEMCAASRKRPVGRNLSFILLTASVPDRQNRAFGLAEDVVSNGPGYVCG